MATDAKLQQVNRAVLDLAAATVEAPAASCKTRRVTPTRPALFEPPAKPVYDAAKAVLDFLLTAMLIILAAPVLLLTALAVKLTSHGPVFYSQTRVGKNGRLFTLYKIRSMAHDCEKASGRAGPRPAIRASRRSAPSCARRTWTSCRSCGTCCAAT